jgi:hypothetical protein
MNLILAIKIIKMIKIVMGTAKAGGCTDMMVKKTTVVVIVIIPTVAMGSILHLNPLQAPFHLNSLS